MGETYWFTEICLSVCLSVCPSVCLSVCLSVTLSFPLSNSNSLYPIFTKLYKNVYWHKMEAKFDNQLNPTRHFGVMALGILKNSDFVLISGSSIYLFFGLCTLLFPLSNSNSFDPIFTKPYENVCWRKMEATFDNEPDCMSSSEVMHNYCFLFVCPL